MQKRSYPFLVFILLFLVSWHAQAQERDFISGKLLDSKTNEPVVFANIRIKDRALGIITNVDGSFKIPLLYKEYGDIIEISSMGYQAKEISLSQLAQDKLNIITIDPSAIDLQEAVVKGKRKRNLTAKQIVQKAIDAIPRNYPSTSFSTVGYYRDYQFKDQEYINLNEGILEVFDQGFDQLDDGTTETRLFNFGLNRDFKQDSLARMPYDYRTNKKVIRKAHLDAYGGNEFRILRIHDAIRNYNVGAYDFIGALKTDLLKNHSFLRSKDTNIDNEELYGIKFWVRYVDYSAHGMIYISKTDFSIYKLTYTLYDETKRIKSMEKNKHGHRQKAIFDIVTDYKKVNDKMYLNYISFHNSFEVRKPPKFVLDSTLVNAPGANCMLYFNNSVDSISAKRPKNYEFFFKQRKFGIEKIEVFQDSVKLYVNPSFKKAMALYRGEMSTLIRKQRSAEIEALFEINARKIRDVEGNLLNEPEIIDYLQFREFFVQRVKPDSRAQLDDQFMDKKKPIFSNQPMTKPKDYKEYWMNTPLQKNVN